MLRWRRQGRTWLILKLDRHSRRRPFVNWVRRLANISSSGSSPRSKKAIPLEKTNSPYLHPAPPTSERPGSGFTGMTSFRSKQSLAASHEEGAYQDTERKSVAPTLATQPGTIHSDTAQSKSTTTAAHRTGGEGSTFSSPTPSTNSLTTTLTTIQSTAPTHLLGSNNNQTTASGSNTQTTHFAHQFPANSAPASAIPPHVVGASGGGHQATYYTATANNLLTDNASIMTLASSSKRRRRNSGDTNASMRALAPSSMFGGSRESLPLSMLSNNMREPGEMTSRGVSGTAAAERASAYSAYGVIPPLTSERNSYYANKQANTGDGGSIKSGMAHGRNDSVTGSIGGNMSTLVGQRETTSVEKRSASVSGWGDLEDDINEKV